MKRLSHFLTIFPFVVAASHAAEVLTTRPLFNGRDLSGWKGEGYVVEDGAIVCTPKGRNLMTEAVYANYVLDFEFQLSPGANNGLGIHYPGTGDAAYTGMEIQMLDSTHPKYKDLKDYQFHGGLYTMAPAKQGFLKPVGEWNQQRVVVFGSSLKVELNGEIILRADLDEMAKKFPKHQGVKRRAGHIGWLGHGDRVAIRNINIGELAPLANEEGVKAAGFTRIFDGNSLKGWKPTEDAASWKPIHGILKHKPQSGGSQDLWSEKAYGDFTMVFDWRWSGRGLPKSQAGTETSEEFDSGVFLRGDSKCEVNLGNGNVGSGKADADLSPNTKADHPPGEWNRTQITLKGELLTVVINGRAVIENARLPGVPERGSIGFQNDGSAIDFANIWIKEF